MAFRGLDRPLRALSFFPDYFVHFWPTQWAAGADKIVLTGTPSLCY